MHHSSSAPVSGERGFPSDQPLQNRSEHMHRTTAVPLAEKLSRISIITRLSSSPKLMRASSDFARSMMLILPAPLRSNALVERPHVSTLRTLQSSALDRSGAGKMSIIERAKSELARINFGDDDSRVMIEILEKFFSQWDSGGAVHVSLRFCSG